MLLQQVASESNLLDKQAVELDRADMAPPRSLKSVTEPQDSFLRRAFPCNRFLLGLGETRADLSRRGRIIGPARTESRQTQADFAPFGMALRLQGGKILA